jgi:cytochrome oxidase Cu insertion factor (SCO1/SenC/PrrC family)
LIAAGIFAAVLPLRAGEGPPPPGSYTLDHIQRVPVGIVLEGTRFPRALSRYTTGAITVFAFFYSYCADPNGCPLAWSAFEKMREEIIARPELHGRVRLVFMSLDPAHDTPEVLRGFARRYEASASIVPWHFLTTYSNLFLNPVLRDMGEEISIDRQAAEGGGAVINHLPKVFLIDKRGIVREIYSNQSLDPAMILGDIKTLLLEEAKADRRKE